MRLKMTDMVVATLLGLATLTFTSAMSAGAMGSVLDLSEDEQNIAAVFSKVAYGGSTTKRSISPKNMPPEMSDAEATAPSPLSSTTTEPSPGPAPTSPSNPELPPYATPNRSFITPPLPAEYADQFSDRPTLRGSHSDSNVRRPVHAPPPPIHIPPEAERIPFRAADLGQTVSKKKALNTPSSSRGAQVAYAELATSTEGTSTRSSNETDFDFVPILDGHPGPSITRILSGSSGRRHDFSDILNSPPRVEFESKAPRTVNQEPPRVMANVEAFSTSTTERSTEAIRTTTVTTTTTTTVRSTTTASTPTAMKPTWVPPRAETQPPPPPPSPKPSPYQPPPQPPQSVEANVVGESEQHVRPSAKQMLGAAWDVHVYLVAVAFALLTAYSVFALLRINAGKRLLPRGYFLSLHGLLAGVGLVRCSFLLYDAYNAGHSLLEPFSHLLLNIGFPMLSAAFALMFLFLMRACEVRVGSGRLQSPSTLAVSAGLYLIVCVILDLSTALAPESNFLSAACQCLFVVVCLSLGLGYMSVYKSLCTAAARKPGFAPLLHRTSLAHAVRAMLATALLAVLMAAVQVYGMLGVYESPGDNQPHPWLWWGFQFSVRVIEIAMCALLCWAGTQPPGKCTPHEDDKETQSQNSSSTAFALFSCGGDSMHANRNDPVEDMYPAVCAANQAMHHYSLRSSTKIYDNAYPLNNIHPVTQGAYAAERHSLKKYAARGEELPLPMPHDSPNVVIKSANGALLSYPSVRRGPVPGPGPGVPGAVHRAQASPSMLVAEDGFVRFRSLADTEHGGTMADNAVARSSLSRKHIALHPAQHPTQQDYSS